MNERFRAGSWGAKLSAMVVGWSLAAMPDVATSQSSAPEIVHLPVQQMLPGGQLAPQVKSRSGLELEVDTRWIDSYGYRPLRFTLRSPKPANSDHQITVRFFADDWADHEFHMAVEQDTELKAGQRSVTVELRAPQLDSWNYGRWEVWVDGAKEPALSLDPSNAISFNRWQQNGLNILSPATNLTIVNQSPNTPITGPFFSGVQMNVVFGPLSSNWLDYTCFDVVAMPLERLISENSIHPERIVALRRWVHAGGNLWIEGTGLQSDRILKIDDLLGLNAPSLEISREGIEEEALPPEWSYAVFRRPAGWSEDRWERDDLNSPPDAALPDAPIEQQPLPQVRPPSDTETPDNSQGWFAERAAGFGSVTAFSDQWDDSPDRLQRSARYIAAMRWYQRSWLPRHGLAPNVPNAEFSNLLIPGVGLAPVTEFRVLITIFVLLIGPLNYWVLSRAKRLYLLVITVPLGAGAVTLLLFAYAFLGDGLSTQLRARSLTFLDQPSGEAVSWSRLSYYAGLAPSSGLSVPDDTAIYPILPENQGWNPRWRRSGRVVEWNGERQELTRGWLASRTPTQYLAVRAHQSDARLEVRAAANRCQVFNELGAPLTWLFVIDESGNCWQATAVEPEERVDLQAVEPNDAMRLLRESLVENKPQMPAELQMNRASQPRSGRNHRWRRGRFRFMVEGGELSLSSNLLEKNLEALTGLSGSADELKGMGRMYLAQAATAVDTPLGSQDVVENASYHLVLGRW